MPLQRARTRQRLRTVYADPTVALRQAGLSGRKVLMVGDSTYDGAGNAPQFYDWITTRLSGARTGLFAGATIVDYGSNGQSSRGFLTDNGAKGFAAAKAAVPDVVFYGYGINDRRSNVVPVDELRRNILTAIDGFRSVNPLCVVVLAEPLALGLTDTGPGYVVPNSAAQQYTDEIREVYRSLDRCRPGVYLLRMQDSIGGRVCSASPSWLSDQLHPNTASYQSRATIFANLIGRAPPFDQAAADAAIAVSYGDPMTTYARACEDPRYWDYITGGAPNNVSAGSGLMDASLEVNGVADSAARNLVGAGDYVIHETGQPWEMPWGFGTSAINSTISRLYSIGSNPGVSQSTGRVRIYRHRWLRDQNVQTYRQNAANTWWRYGRIAGGGSGYMDIERHPIWHADNASGWDLRVGDTIIIVGQSPVVITGSFGTNGSNKRWNIAGSWAANAGKYCAVLGAH